MSRERIAKWIVTVLGVGLLKPAPGTWGSLAALPLAWVLHQVGGFPLLLVAIIAAYAKAMWAIPIYAGDGDPDRSEIVIDELVGQWIALTALSYPAWAHGIDISLLWPGWISAFVLFRLFDIWKPGPVGWADRRKDPTGVMLDDVIAGIFAALGTLVLAALYHGVIQ